MVNEYQLAAYYFPNYHPDPRNAVWHGTGWTEWELVKAARSRFPGHEQPKIPLWGYEDESEPDVMAKKIAAAADHGITTFIFDWYWYEDGPFLQRALERGFLGAHNNDRLKFAIMWANHDWHNCHPALRVRSDDLLIRGAVSEKAFVEATDHMIKTYFCHPSYWRVNGGLYVSFYQIKTLLDGLGGVENTRRVLDDFRERTRQAGYGELHLNAIVYRLPVIPGDSVIKDANSLLNALGFDSVTSYVWVHHQLMEKFPITSYPEYRKKCLNDYERFTNHYNLPYYPNVTMGWDSSPRTVQTDVYENVGSPFSPVLGGNTPEEFEEALIDAKAFLDRGLTKPKMLTINAWNEWTEGSYLEPDTVHGMGYLEAIKRVFG